MIEVKTITGAEMTAAWSTKSQFLDALADAANLVEAEHTAPALPVQSQTSLMMTVSIDKES
jgi:hypothetical protein